MFTFQYRQLHPCAPAEALSRAWRTYIVCLLPCVILIADPSNYVC